MKKLTNMTELEGKTIRGVFDEHHGNGLVLVAQNNEKKPPSCANKPRA